MQPQLTDNSVKDSLDLLIPLTILGMAVIHSLVLYLFPAKRVGMNTAVNMMRGREPDDPSGLDDETYLGALIFAISLFVAILVLALLHGLFPQIGAFWAFLLATLTSFLVMAALNATVHHLSTGTSHEQVSTSPEEDVKQLRSEESSKANGEEAEPTPSEERTTSAVPSSKEPSPREGIESSAEEI